MCKVYTGYCGTSEIEHGLCACTVDNPLAKARGLSLRTGAQPCSVSHMYFVQNSEIIFLLSLFLSTISKNTGRPSAVFLHDCIGNTVKILKFGTPQTIAIIVLKIEKFDVTLH